MRTIYTIGYSSYQIDSFTAVLIKLGINAVADVRSSPYSKFNPDFNKEPLTTALKAQGISYVFLGDYCGARYSDRSCYTEDGRADYNKIAKHPKFLEGLKRILDGSSKFQIALMCAEKDPITCHRTILICKNLKGKGVIIKHILEGGSVEDHLTAEGRLVSLYKLDQPDLFMGSEQLLEEAYEKQALNIAYRLNGEPNGE
jgi:uncharacterized protein (DUF488 family)